MEDFSERLKSFEAFALAIAFASPALAANAEVAAHNYMLLDKGDGYTMFEGAPLLLDCVKLDNQLLIDCIVYTFGGVIGDKYAEPYGEGRIKNIESAP